MRHFTIIILLISTLFASGQTTDKINSAAFKKGNKMDKQEFWKIINFSFDKAQHDKTLQEKLIIDQLSSYTTDQIIEFEIIFRQLVIEADDFKVMAAGKIIEGHVTDDTYLYFRCWLVGQGEKTFTETLKNPDYLSDVVDKQTECSFEELMYVATTAFEQKTGKKEEDDSYPRNVAFKRGFNYDFGAPPTKGTNWKTEQLPQLYPKLWVKFN